MFQPLKKIGTLGLLAMALASFAATPLSLAAEDEERSMPSIPQPYFLPGPDESADQSTVQEYFRNQAIPTFIQGFLGLIAGLALVALIFSGIRFMTAYGNEEGISQAKRMAVYSVVGFGITILAFTIVSIINTLAFPEGEYESNSNQETIEYDDI